MLKLARQKYQWQASVGADPAEVVRIEPGAVGLANWGREYPGPCVIGRGCKFREMSFVVLGGDRKTSVVTARHRAKSKRVPTPIQGATAMSFEEWLLTMGFGADAELTDVQMANLKKKFLEEYPEDDTGETETETPAVEPAAAAAAPAAAAAAARPPAVRASRPAPRPARTPADADNHRIAANMERVERINRVHAEHGSPTITVGGQPVSLAAHAIRNGWSADRAELEIIRAGRPNPQPRRAAGNDADRLQALTVETAVCITAGLKPDALATGIAAADRERVMNEASGTRFRGYSLHNVMDETIRAAGQNYHGSRKNNDFIRAAFEADRMIRAAGGFTTVSLTNVLGNTANKAMLASYDSQVTTWKGIAAIRSHSDFKAVSRFRLDSTGAFKKVGPDGELKHVGLADTAYTNQLATYGAIIALTRQMMINDDLQAFLEIPRLLGRMSAVRVEEAVYVTLLSNPSSFFHANNSNLLTGGGSVLAIAGLTDAETAFANQVDSNGKPIMTAPDRILVGTALGVAARSLYNETVLGAASGVPSTTVPTNNPHVGKFEPVMTPYLNNTSIRDQDGVAISGQSATLWYLFADPAVRAAIAVAFLNGQETPTIEDAETDFATLGRQWRAYHDFGVGMEDTTAALKNNGA